MKKIKAPHVATVAALGLLALVGYLAWRYYKGKQQGTSTVATSPVVAATPEQEPYWYTEGEYSTMGTDFYPPAKTTGGSGGGSTTGSKSSTSPALGSDINPGGTIIKVTPTTTSSAAGSSNPSSTGPKAA